MRFVDTNIFLRFLVNDIPEKADACEALFRRAVCGKEELFTTGLVIAEIVWVLESYYERDRKEIREKVEKILNTPNLFCSEKDLIIQALALYEDRNIDYIDALNACLLRVQGIREVYSYDRHYDRLAGIKRLEPNGS